MSKSVLNPLEIARGMEKSILASAFGSFFGVCIALQFLTGFAQSLGASVIQIGLLTSLPMLGLALQLVAILLARHLRQRKPLWFRLSVVHSFLWFPIALIPFLVGYFDLGSKTAMILFLGLFFLSSILGSISVPFWFSWMADLVPKEQSGKFWGRRTAMVSLMNVFAIPLGWFADYFPKDNLLPYAGLFLLAGIMGGMGAWIHNQVAEPILPLPPAPVSWWRSMGEPFQQTDFRKLLFFICGWNFAVFFADGFVVFFFLKNIGLSQSFIACAASLMWLMRWMMARYWGFLGDRFGHSAVLKVCASALVIWPLGLVFWGYSYPKASLLGVYLYMGIFNIGFETAFVALMLGLAPSSKKSLYVSVLHSCAGLIASVAPLLGGVFLEWTSHDVGFLAPLDHFQILFLMASFFRLLVVCGCRLKFNEVKGDSPVMLVRRLIDANPFKVIHHSYVLNEGVEESQRVDAVHELADAKSEIASEQLIDALGDPSLEVRRGAVRALVEIGEKSCLPALFKAAQSPESQIQSEAIEALGHIGDRSITPFLISLLEDPNLRLPALRGLASLRDPNSLKAVQYWSLSASVPEVRATAFEAWNCLGDVDSIGSCLRFIRECKHELPRWQATLGLAKMTVFPVNCYSVLQKELRVRGEMVISETQFVDYFPLAHGKKHRLKKDTTNLFQKIQSCYMDGQWNEALIGFTLISLICLDVISPKTADAAFLNQAAREQVLKSLQKTISEWMTTQPRFLLSLHLAKSLLELERTSMSQPTHEEVILAYALLLKTLRYY